MRWPNPCWGARSICSSSSPFWRRAPPASSPRSFRRHAPCWRWARTAPSPSASRRYIRAFRRRPLRRWPPASAPATFYAVLTFVSENVLTDTIYSLGIMICFYYGLVAFACIWYFRRELTRSTSDFVYKLLFPLLGGLGLALVFFITLRDSASPDYGSGASVLGVGLVLVLGLGLIAHRAAVHAVAAQQRSGVLPRRDSGQGHACARGRGLKEPPWHRIPSSR